MIVNIQSRHFSITPSLSDHIQSKIRLILSRFEHKIMRIEVCLSDVNGPKGGEDKHCKIIIKPSHSPTIVVQETASDMYDAISACARRVRRTVKRNFSFPTWQRERFHPGMVLQD